MSPLVSSPSPTTPAVFLKSASCYSASSSERFTACTCVVTKDSADMASSDFQAWCRSK